MQSHETDGPPKKFKLGQQLIAFLTAAGVNPSKRPGGNLANLSSELERAKLPLAHDDVASELRLTQSKFHNAVRTQRSKFLRVGLTSEKQKIFESRTAC